MNTLIVTRHNWGSWPEKVRAIQGGLRLAKNNQGAQVDVMVHDFPDPEEEGGRITHDWFEENISPIAVARGYQGVILHLDPREAKNIKDGLRGVHFRDRNRLSEMWVVSAETDKILYKSGRSVDRFTKVALHELSHAMAFSLGVKDNTHYWDYEKEFVAGAFMHYTVPPRFWQAVTRAVENIFYRKKKLRPRVQRLADRLLKAMEILGHPIVVTQGYRSCEEQDKLYAQGRTRPGQIVTNARCGESLHNYGVAFDVAFLENGSPSWKEYHPWDTLGLMGKILGLEWGGDWKGFVDRPHFQLTLGYQLSDYQHDRVDYSRYF